MRWGVLWRLIPKWQDSSSYAIISAGIHQFVHMFFFSCGTLFIEFMNHMVIVQYRIIEPLASRCAKFRFKPLSEDVMSNRILHICSEEGLTLDAQVTLQFSLRNIYRYQAYCQLKCCYKPLISFWLILTYWVASVFSILGIVHIKCHLSRRSSSCYNLPSGLMVFLVSPSPLFYGLSVFILFYFLLLQSAARLFGSSISSSDLISVSGVLHHSLSCKWLSYMSRY